MNKFITFLCLNALLIGSASLAMNGLPAILSSEALAQGEAPKSDGWDSDQGQQNRLDRSLISAASMGNEKEVKRLIEQGASRKAKTGALARAVYSFKSTPICKMLLEHKASANERDSDGMTPLMYAAMLGRGATCQLLIDHNAQIDAKNNESKTALQLTPTCNLSSTGRFLINGMLKSIKTSDAIIALLGIKKFRNQPDLKPIDTHVLKIIACYMRGPFAYSKQKLIEQIDRIEVTDNYDQRHKEELLDYALTQLNSKKQNNHCIIA